MTQSRNVQLLAEKAQEELWSALRTGRLRGGQFISISQLVALLDCPIAAVREAVKQASSQGLLTTYPKRGLQVMEAHPDTIRECLDFRRVLDQEGARRRISHNALSGLDELRGQHEAMRQTASADLRPELPPKAIAVDLSLHNYLAEGLENSQLAAAYDANKMRIAIIQNVRPFLQDRIVSAMEEHLEIIDAMENRQTERALQAIDHHCAQTLRWWGVA
ncbi:GntR family transcriptional regulator [Aliiroseovarius sp. Z3]|uniref:GntR family transcriptional regulator n=1 Tax=Aliiroseovarius sp. Z3 TaxID=2811402 RepID=UPI0023B2C123|nr:GntR family transcriptional regulator [Aliiroseovarius sp. Z3]MDE9450611.1 GntR family transcriptional regulator [Aliiroseovarius sp. Z3]